MIDTYNGSLNQEVVVGIGIGTGVIQAVLEGNHTTWRRKSLTIIRSRGHRGSINSKILIRSSRHINVILLFPRANRCRQNLAQHLIRAVVTHRELLDILHHNIVLVNNEVGRLVQLHADILANPIENLIAILTLGKLLKVTKNTYTKVDAIVLIANKLQLAHIQRHKVVVVGESLVTLTLNLPRHSKHNICLIISAIAPV